MWRGDFLKAGVEANGFDLNIYRGNIYAKNFPGGDLTSMVFGESAQHWYVDGDITASGNGETWENAFKTITEAIAAAQDNDVIFIAPGMYNEGAKLTISQDNLRIVGAGHYGAYVSWITNTADYGLMDITGSGCVIAGIELYQTQANYGVNVQGDSNRIQDCNVDGTGSGTIGVNLDGADWCVVERCTIYNWATSAVEVDGDYDVVMDNLIGLVASGIGVDFTEAAGASFCRVIRNVIRGANDSDTGVKLAAGTVAEGLSLAWNQVDNCATPVTAGFDTELYDGNFWGIDDAEYHSKARTLYVDSLVSASGDGRCWKSAFKTVLAAVAAAVDYDTIIIREGIYDAGAVIEITQKALRLLGENTTHYMYGTTSLKASAANHIILDIQADQVEIAYLSFIQNNANKVIQIDHTAAVYKTHIHDCHFGSAAATYGIDAGGTFDAVDTIIERCHFTVGTALVGVRMNATRSALIDCYFAIAGSGSGYVHTPNTADRPYTRVIGCKFHAEDVVNGNGVVVSNTPTAGMFYVGDCLFSYFASDNKAVSVRTGYCGLNWRDAAVLPVT